MGAQIRVPSGPGQGHGLADGSRSKLIPAPEVQLSITIISKYRIQDVVGHLIVSHHLIMAVCTHIQHVCSEALRMRSACHAISAWRV